MSRGMPRRVDANQAEIVKGLRQLGYSVLDTSAVGGGFPDLVVGKNEQTFLLEIKTAKGKLNPLQEKWHANWRGQVAVVRTIEQAIAAIRLPFE